MQLVFREVDRARYEEVRTGVKTIETRAATPKYQSLKVGEELTFACGDDSFNKRIVKKYHWPSEEAMVAEVGVKKVMPELETLEQVKARYATYPDYPEKIKEFGLLGFELA